MDTKNFKQAEFKCKCGKCSFGAIDPRVMALCQTIRDMLGEPIRINSGCRCKEHNERVGGVKESYHTQGMAADLSCKSGSKKLYKTIMHLYEKQGKIQDLQYAQHYIKSNFVHVDIGKKRVRRFVEVNK
jgi:uncharacterized protein YcbK (DUF882 family)